MTEHTLTPTCHNENLACENENSSAATKTWSSHIKKKKKKKEWVQVASWGFAGFKSQRDLCGHKRRLVGLKRTFEHTWFSPHMDRILKVLVALFCSVHLQEQVETVKPRVSQIFCKPLGF